MLRLLVSGSEDCEEFALPHLKLEMWGTHFSCWVECTKGNCRTLSTDQDLWVGTSNLGDP